MKAFAFTKRSLLTIGFIAALVVAAVTAGIYAGTNATSGVRDCTDNAIIKCGALSIAELKQKFKANAEGDLPAIYAHYGININQMNSSNTKSGIVNGKGEVIVNGQVVAVNAYTIGRKPRPMANKPITINGRGYHERVNTSNFGSITLDAFVVFDQFGRFKYSVLKECGNPAPATPTKPPASAKCESLTSKKVNRNTYSFATKARVTNGAKITGYEFDFGDGTKKTSTKQSIQHTYAKPGNYTAKVTVKTTLGNRTGANCATKVVVEKKPTAICEALTSKKINRNTYSFTARAGAINGATVSGYVFDFGDGNTKTSTTPVVQHTYDKPGNYTAKVTVKTSVGDKTGSQCTVQITVDKEKTPGVSIDKLVDGLKHKSVAVNKEFDYELTVRNTGETNLTDVVVTDNAPEHVAFLRADKGEIKDNKWSYTIPSLKIGEEVKFTITAKVTKEVEGTIKNTACVDAPTVPGNPDDCDDATVEVPPVPMIEVCELATDKIITIKKDEFDETKHSTNFDDCKAPEPTPEVPVELPTTGIAGTLMQLFGLSTLTASIIYYAVSASRR